MTAIPEILLGGRRIADDTAPYVIAEIGVNHEGSLDRAKALIDGAKAGGADAAKFQTYKADTLASRHSPAYWDTSQEPTLSQHELFKKHDTFGDDEYRALAEHCHAVGINFLSTPFDDHAIDFLDPMMSFYKIASADLTNVPFLRRIAAKKKPVVLSTGASTLTEIAAAVDELAAHGSGPVALLHCVLNYPTPNEHAHLNMIEGLRRAFPDHVIGYSDHTLPDPAMAVLTAAVLKGARVIEKHFTHDKTLPGNDHYHAMDEEDLTRFSATLDLLRTVEGETNKAPLKSEEISRLNARRSIVVTGAVKAGDRLGEGNLTCKRPGTGISPLFWDQVVGATARTDLEDDAVLAWADLEPAAEGSS